MHVSKRTALGAAAIAAVAFAVPSFANPGHPAGGGGGPIQCKDDTTQQPMDGDITWTPSTIWPPNHKLTPIAITITERDGDGDTTTIAAPMATHNQMTDGVEDVGAGNTPDDFTPGQPASAEDPGTATTTPQVRSERSGKDGDRVYDITVTCTKTMTNDPTATPIETGTAHVLVTVPHDQGHRS